MSELLNEEIEELRADHAESAETLKIGHQVLHEAGMALAQARLAFDVERGIRMPRDDIALKLAAYRSLGTSHIEDHDIYTSDLAEAQHHFEQNQSAYVEQALEDASADGKVINLEQTSNPRTEIIAEESEEEREES